MPEPKNTRDDKERHTDVTGHWLGGHGRQVSKISVSSKNADQLSDAVCLCSLALVTASLVTVPSKLLLFQCMRSQRPGEKEPARTVPPGEACHEERLDDFG